MDAIAYRLLLPVMWVGWATYWWVTSKKVKADVRQESVASRLAHIVPLVIAGMLLWAEKLRIGVLGEPVVPWSPWIFWVGAAVAATGFLFAVWARVNLAGNWSSTVTLKEGHELIATGPYGLVRHPIYTGVLLAFVGSAIARDEWRGVLAVLIAWLALWRKYRLEEKWMVETFGNKYIEYKRRVPALFPLPWRRS